MLGYIYEIDNGVRGRKIVFMKEKVINWQKLNDVAQSHFLTR